MQKFWLKQFVFVLAFLLLLPFQVWNGIVFPVQNGKILFGGWAALVLISLQPTLK